MRLQTFFLGATILLGVLPAQAASVSVSPANASLLPNATQKFAATVAGNGSQSVVWLVNGVRGGAPSIGVVDATGLYTAPATVPAATHVEVEAASVAEPTAYGTAGVALAASAPSTTILHVSPRGDDNADGGAAAPWRTIQHGVDLAPPGATVLVHGGVYRELVKIKRSGSAAAGFISLRAAPKEVAVIDGDGLELPKPREEKGLVTIDGASWVRVEGLELRNYKSTTTAVPVGIFVHGSGDHIELRHNRIHDITTEENSAEDNASGILVRGESPTVPISQLIIDSNEIFGLQLGFSESLSLTGNVSVWQVTGNTIHDNDNIGINIEGFFNLKPPKDYDQARNGLVAGNAVYNISSKDNASYGGELGADGLYVDGGANVTLQQNLVHDTDIGIELASEVKGRATTGVIVRSNIVYHSLTAGLSIGGAKKAANGGATYCTVVNNTFFANDTTASGSGELQFQHNATSNVVFNNIVSAKTQGRLINNSHAGSTAPAVLDHNIYFSDKPNASEWIWAGKRYAKLAGYQKASKQDQTSLFDDPKFVDINTPDKEGLRLDGTSKAIGAGVNLGLVREGLVDFAGQPRLRGTVVDAGAYAR